MKTHNKFIHGLGNDDPFWIRAEESFLKMAASKESVDKIGSVYSCSAINHRKLNFLRITKKPLDPTDCPQIDEIFKSKRKIDFVVRVPRNSATDLIKLYSKLKRHGEPIVHFELPLSASKCCYVGTDYEITPANNEKLIESWETIHEEARERTTPNSLSRLYRQVHETGEHEYFVLHYKNIAVASFGVSWLSEDTFNLWGVSTLPTYQRRGHQKSLMKIFTSIYDGSRLYLQANENSMSFEMYRNFPGSNIIEIEDTYALKNA